MKLRVRKINFDTKQCVCKYSIKINVLLSAVLTCIFKIVIKHFFGYRDKYTFKDLFVKFYRKEALRKGFQNKSFLRASLCSLRI